jgi:hypothetical protein
VVTHSRLTVVKITSEKEKRMYRDGAPPMRPSTEDYETWMALQAEATKQQRYFAT